MSTRLTSHKPDEVIRKLKKLGFEGPFSGGKHMFMRHPETFVKIPIPYHRSKDIATGTLSKIIKLTGTTVEEWNKL